MFIIIVFWLGCDRPSGLHFSRPLCFFPYSRLSSYLLRLFLYLIFIFAVPIRECLGKLLHEFLISYSDTEWYLLFSDSATTSAHCVSGAKK